MLPIYNLHVCKHSVTVVASIRYPLHILHVIYGFNDFSLIRRSIIVSTTKNQIVKNN